MKKIRTITIALLLVLMSAFTLTLASCSGDGSVGGDGIVITEVL